MNEKKENRLWKWVKRILLGLLAIVALLTAVVAVLIFYDSQFGLNSAEITNTEFTNEEGEVLRGYLAQPTGAGPQPAVLLIHEWWGLNEGITILADALAAEGYVVFAPDAYRGEVTASVSRALWLTLTIPRERVQADLDAALLHLRSLDSVNTEKVASLGFCFGGGHSLQLGLRQSENLAVTAMYYGAVVTEPELLRPLVEAQPVLGIFAEEDQQIFVEDVLEFEAALTSLNIENEITIYDNVGHGFLNEHNFNQPGPAMDAWQQTLDFLERNLASEE